DDALTEEVMLQAGRIPKHTAQQMVQVARDRIDSLVASVKTSATQHQAALIAEAEEKMLQLTSQELQRLQQLAEHNTHIKEAEIELLQTRQQQLQQYLQQAELKLDALRLIIVTQSR